MSERKIETKDKNRGAGNSFERTLGPSRNAAFFEIARRNAKLSVSHPKTDLLVEVESEQSKDLLEKILIGIEPLNKIDGIRHIIQDYAINDLRNHGLFALTNNLEEFASLVAQGITPSVKAIDNFNDKLKEQKNVEPENFTEFIKKILSSPAFGKNLDLAEYTYRLIHDVSFVVMDGTIKRDYMQKIFAKIKIYTGKHSYEPRYFDPQSTPSPTEKFIQEMQLQKLVNNGQDGTKHLRGIRDNLVQLPIRPEIKLYLAVRFAELLDNEMRGEFYIAMSVFDLQNLKGARDFLGRFVPETPVMFIDLENNAEEESSSLEHS